MHCMFENLGNMNDIYCSLCLHVYFHFFFFQAFGILVIPSNQPPRLSLPPTPPPARARGGLFHFGALH